MLTYRNNDDKYIYIPKALSTRTEETVNSLRKEFTEFVSNELHGEYDRGFFKALEDYLAMLPTLKKPAQPLTQVSLDNPKEEVKGERTE